MGAPGMRDALSEAIRSIVLPRLVAANHAHDIALAHQGSGISEQDVGTMLSHVLTPDQPVAEAMLTVLRLRGVTRADVLAVLFPAVARRLGALWQADRCTFADAALAAGRLQRLIHSEAMPAPQPQAARATGRVLVCSLPGDQHALAAAIVDDFFRCAGWTTTLAPGADAGRLAAMAESEPFDVVGISIADRRRLGELASLARSLRDASSKRLVGVIAGGGAFAGPDRPGRFGVDAIVRDARAAVATAEELLPKA
jgi:MerR family transcriptional regulator, light-induced transcriptional regulator